MIVSTLTVLAELLLIASGCISFSIEAVNLIESLLFLSGHFYNESSYSFGVFNLSLR